MVSCLKSTVSAGGGHWSLPGCCGWDQSLFVYGLPDGVDMGVDMGVGKGGHWLMGYTGRSVIGYTV